MKRLVLAISVLLVTTTAALAQTREVGRINYNWRLLGSDDHIVIMAVDDPKIEGVVCHWSMARKGGLKGAVGLADDPVEASLACRQVGPVKIIKSFENGENIAKTSTNWTGFKTMQVTRTCDVKTNTLIYLVYTDEWFSGFPHNSISSVPISPWIERTEWKSERFDVMKCSDFVKK